MAGYIMALDQGTTSSRAILFDETGSIVAVEAKEFKQIYPKPGWVEHDPEEIWASQLTVATQVIQKSGVSPKDIKGIGHSALRCSVECESARVAPVQRPSRDAGVSSLRMSA